ncbi:MAG TPA: MarR family winged helix-turn-helix transcriptional regulator [Bacillota bacterium]|nr:MarR family winged helix-turn-helix transcriptional regulator [Bacillota bacterium]
MNMNKQSQIETLQNVFHAITEQLQSLDTSAQYGMTCIELTILDLVANQPEVIIKDIGEQLNVAGSTLTSAIDRLEKRDFLRRTLTPRDRRSYGLELTAKGKTVLAEHHLAEIQTWEKILDALDDEAERLTFLQLLKKIAARL